MTADAGVASDAAVSGLSDQEAARRLQGRASRQQRSSRSYASIVRANVLTIFNLILVGFGALTLFFGDWRDALFLGTLVANTTIGIAQEVRAKRTLDRLALLVAPSAMVIRGDRELRLPADDVVEGDLVRLSPGDQVIADGRVVTMDRVLIDASVLTGETRAVPVLAGDALRSGAFVVEGSCLMKVDAVGEHSYAGHLLSEARMFRRQRSPLERAVNRVLLATLGLAFALGSVLVYTLLHRDTDAHEAVATATAGVITLVPEGLVLLMSVTFAVGAIRMARLGVLTQRLSAIESLASADIICLDKTGTLTEAALRVVDVVAAQGVTREQLERSLAVYAASASVRNATLGAIAEAYPGAAGELEAQVAFASRRRWGAIALADGALVLGAPELLAREPLLAAATEHQQAGRRVVALARARGPLDRGVEPALPNALEPLGLVVLAERLRNEARATVAFFLEQGVELKILSGDAPATVAAIAADAGLDVGRVLSGDELPEDPDALAELMDQVGVVGRISPEGKRDVVIALGRRGHHVAMVGDGVNDVPALKAAQLAIAQGSGTQMAKSVSDLVLVTGDFAVIPGLIAEGRQMLRNLQRVAKLFLAKSAFAAFLILTIGISTTAYPLLPRHLTLAAVLTISVPTFLVALAPSSGDWQATHFARKAAQFAVPAGMLVGVGVVSSYLFALHGLDYSLNHARTVATTVLVLVGFYLVLVLESQGRRRTDAVRGMCAVLGVVYVVALALPRTRSFFDLADPTIGMVVTAACSTVVAVAALAAAGFTPGRPGAASRE
jgi:P-type E1-E2 ATPase